MKDFIKKISNKNKEPKSLKRRLLIFMILCWAVPVTVFFTFTTISYREGIIDKTEAVMEDELKNIASFASIRIEEAINLCQRPSYEKTWENAWWDYQDGDISKTDFLQNVDSNLRGKFYLDERFNRYAFYLYGEKRASCYSSRIGASFIEFQEDYQEEINEIIELDSSYTFVKVIHGRVFIIRNLYTTAQYERYGTLVVELNKHQLFQDVPKDIQNNMVICIDTNKERLDFTDGQDDTKSKLVDELFENYNSIDNRTITRLNNSQYNGYLYQERSENYHIGVALLTKRSELYSSLYDLYKIVALMILLFVPLMSFGVYFLRKEIQSPILKLVKASKEIENGKFGIEVESGKMPSTEFNYLMESFNSMSSQVKYLFDYAYDEKLARKDAQILALQAQINPHFLNNTLEMMNWQARMSGDMVVSKMIEALGTVLNFRMNRANVKEVHLSEELQCTDAYLYIMSMRFGQRLQVERQIDDDLLYLFVPPLILQPIVENAIVHGIETVKNGAVHLHVFHDDDNVYLQVKNNGKNMDAAKLAQIQAMLENEDAPDQSTDHRSIGIRNVNQRIKLVYGEEYGLKIEQTEEGLVISTITIPYKENRDVSERSDREKVESELKNMHKHKQEL